MTEPRQRPNQSWRRQKDGQPPDNDNRAYRWDRRIRRWVTIDGPVGHQGIDSLSLMQGTAYRFAETNEY